MMLVDSVPIADLQVDDDLPAGALHDIYVEQVSEIYPRGAAFRCARGCEHELPVSVGRLAEIIFNGGWPKHCGVDMVICEQPTEAGQ
jgi:hypothetical protein